MHQRLLLLLISGDAEITGTLTAGEVSAITLDIGGNSHRNSELNISMSAITKMTAETNKLDAEGPQRLQNLTMLITTLEQKLVKQWL